MTGTLVSELSGYAFSPLREGNFPLYRGSGKCLAPMLVIAEDTSHRNPARGCGAPSASARQSKRGKPWRSRRRHC
jgi:hypothetical protein